jgi:hypothetical protein
MKLKYFLLGALLIPTLGHAQSSAKLIGLTHSTYSGSSFVPVDSSWLSYSNGRGSDVSTNNAFYPSLQMTPTGQAGTFNYDTWATGTYDSAMTWNMTGQHTQAFDSASGMLLSDTYSMPDSSGWKDVSRVNYEYDSMGTLLAQVSQNKMDSTWENVMRYAYTYDPAHNITSITMLTWNASMWNNTSKNVYYYNFLNKVTSSLVQTWNDSSASWMNSEHYIYYSHDNNVTVDSVYYQQMMAPNWMTITKEVYANDGNNDAIAHWHYDNGMLMWGDSTTYNGMHSKTMQLHQVWDTTSMMLVRTKQYNWAYNAWNQPTTYISSTWDASGFWTYNNTDMMTAYYYMTDTSLHVAQVANVADVQLYPVPAQNVMNLDLNWNEPQTFTVAIFDVQGRIMRQWAEPATATYSKSIPVMDLANGNYFISIRSKAGNIARQFTVAH